MLNLFVPDFIEILLEKKLKNKKTKLQQCM